MRVQDYIARHDRVVPTVGTRETIGNLARFLQRNRVGAAVVTDDGRTIDGIISERDIAYSLAERRGELHLLPVSALMTRRVVTCAPDDTLSKVLHLMTEHHIRHVPVRSRDGIAGLLSIRDLVQFRLDAIERRANLAMLLYAD